MSDNESPDKKNEANKPAPAPAEASKAGEAAKPEPDAAKADVKIEAKPAEKKPEPPKKTASKKEAKPKTSGGGFTKFLLLLIIAGTGGGSYYFWQQLQLEKAQVAQLQTQIVNTKAEVAATLSDFGQKTQSTLENMNQTQADVRTNLDNLFTRIGNTSRDWLVAEAEHLIHIANHRLQLARDKNTALAALRLADQSLKKAADPSLNSIRETLGKEIASLEVLGIPDYEGLAAEITGLQVQIDSLPFIVKTSLPKEEKMQAAVEEPQTEPSTVDKFFAGIWQALKGLVTVRRHERPVEPLMAPDQMENLKANLKLKLEQARLALLQLQPEVFKSSVSTTREWIGSYFDKEQDMTKQFVSRLQQMADINIKPQMPDISKSLETIRAFKQKAQLSQSASSGKSPS
ncbi:MAG: uroporphyrinogen-III C-methyltransferase [Gammaproteobacteria bacterium]|nr:uroporphyrinogen-III C-methyltransferase [Gammaproteobacteria bacterium]